MGKDGIDIEQVNRKLDILLAYMMKKDSVSVIHLTDTVKYVANSNLNRAKYAANNPNAARYVAGNDPNSAKYVAKSSPNAVMPVANNSNKDISLQKQLDMINKSIKDLSNQQKLLAAAVVPLATYYEIGRASCRERV